MSRMAWVAMAILVAFTASCTKAPKTENNVRQALAPDGTWLIVEPIAGDRTEQNFNPVGRAYYAFSTFLCTPSSLSQDIGLALGAQAGEARIRDVVTAGGFTRFRRVAETPFNLVYEARP